jgi:hypothetical protein
VFSLLRSTAALLLLGVAACASQLPSERPLGIGPLARMRPPAEPSGPPVTMPGAAAPTMIETDDDDDGDGDDTREKLGSGSGSATEAPDAGIASTKDAGAAPAPSTPSSAPATGTVDFVGNYAGLDVSVYRVDGTQIREEKDPKALMSVKKNGSRLAVVIVASNTGDPLCTLNGDQKGDTVTLASGQQCPEPRNPFLGANVASGSAKLQGTKLTVDITFEANIDFEGEQHKGSVEYHFEGTRR